MATKNNPKNKGTSAKKFYNGKEVEPIKYIGRHVGEGSYISAKYAKTSEIILDSNGKPILLDSLPISAE